ncbi:MAG: acyl-ACP thioesterase [Treponema sp.]|jgi:acyl-ACP thioesterase|nr:acyl-ACP thioesterase [Treponema sp.]
MELNICMFFVTLCIMGMLDIWQETVPVRFGVIDRSNRLTLDAVFRFFQEAAISHAENLGVGRDAMAKTNQVWILSRMSVLVERRPRYGEIITVRSWPRGGEKLFALRDYDIRDANDNAAVRARSGWLIIDIEKRRPLRPQQVMDALPLNGGLDALPSGAAALVERTNLLKTGECPARYTSVDYNGHVNNVRYIQWIQDSMDMELLEKADKMRMDINYLNEILPGEVTGIWSAPAESGTDGPPPLCAMAFEGRKEESGQAAFRAELRLWQTP